MLASQPPATPWSLVPDALNSYLGSRPETGRLTRSCLVNHGPVRSPSKDLVWAQSSPPPGINAKIRWRRGPSRLRSPDPYAELSRSMPLPQAGGDRSPAHGGPLDLGAPPWADLDGPSLTTAAAALQLLPENISCLTRAQRLAAIGAALPVRPGAPPLSSSRLRAVLKDQLISGKDVRTQEDPYDDLYVEEVAFHGGPRLVLQGLTNHSAHTVRILLNAIFSPAGAALPAGYLHQAGLLATTVPTLGCGAAPPRRRHNAATRLFPAAPGSPNSTLHSRSPPMTCPAFFPTAERKHWRDGSPRQAPIG
jgi:hypothetical protein